MGLNGTIRASRPSLRAPPTWCAASTSPRRPATWTRLRATLAPDVEWTEMAGFPLAGTYRTPEGVTSHVMEVLGQ